MNLNDMILHRRSVRKYTGAPIPAEQLEMILQAGIASESSRARRPWELYVVTSPELLQSLAGCRVGAARMLEKAGAAIVVFGCPEVSDVWVEDCSIVMAHMHLMADHLGLGSCWIQGRLREAPDGRTTDAYIKDLLNIPKAYALEAILSIGIMDGEHPAPIAPASLPQTKVHMI